MTEIRGHCRDCFYKRQMWVFDTADMTTEELAQLPEGYRGKLVLDRWCDIFDTLVPDTGYCHCFEHEVTL